MGYKAWLVVSSLATHLGGFLAEAMDVREATKSE